MNVLSGGLCLAATTEGMVEGILRTSGHQPPSFGAKQCAGDRRDTELCSRYETVVRIQNSVYKIENKCVF